LSLDTINNVASSKIEWTSTEPTDTNITIECAVNEDSETEPSDLDYAEATSGQAIPGISAEDDLTGKYLWVRQILTTDDVNNTPQLHGLTVEVVVENVSIDTGPLFEEVVFNYMPVSHAMDALAERAGFWWRIDEHLKLHFVTRAKYTAPWTATAADMLADSITVEYSGAKYRNKQVIKGPRDLTSEQTEVQKGDGDKQTFTVGYPIARVPTVEVDTGTGYVTKTVGIKGLEDDKDWYWNAGEPTVTQEAGHTPLSATDKIRIKYRGEFPVIIISQNSGQILDRQGVEGVGTGVVEDVRSEPQQSTREAAFQLAAQLLEKYSTMGGKLKFTTTRSGLEPGHLLYVDLPSYGFNNDEVLIESVNAYDVHGKYVWYDVTAIEGPEMGSWAKLFEEIAKRGEMTVREHIGAGEIVIIPLQLSKTWTEGETPNIFTEIYPDAGHTPGGIYPSFDPNHRVRYLEWHDAGGAVERKHITQQTGADTAEIFTLTYMEPGDGAGVTVTEFAWIGGLDAAEALGTGIEVDKQAHPEGTTLKTTSAAWQVEKTDTKWS